MRRVRDIGPWHDAPKAVPALRHWRDYEVPRLKRGRTDQLTDDIVTMSKKKSQACFRFAPTHRTGSSGRKERTSRARGSGDPMTTTMPWSVGACLVNDGADERHWLNQNERSAITNERFVGPHERLNAQIRALNQFA